MTDATARFWTLIARTRPAWGYIPLRIVFGSILLIEGLSRLSEVHKAGSLLSQLPHNLALGIAIAFTVIEILAGVLAIPGFLMRFAAAAVLVETFVAILFERVPLDFSGDLRAQILLVAVASFFFLSGAGRYSVDHYLARKALKHRPEEKWELYVYAETPLSRWWE